MEMKDFFPSELKLHGDTIEDSEFAYAVMSCEYIVNENDAGDAICHAVNNHDKLIEALKSVVQLQKAHYGNGMATHLALITKAKEIESFLVSLEEK